MNVSTVNATAEAELRNLLNDWEEAVRSKDVERISAFYTPDVVAYDAVVALQFKGRDAYMRHWEACMAMCPGAMTFKIHDLKIVAADELAFGHYLTLCGGEDEKGEVQSSWMRASVGFRKENGRWLIAHDHFSAPFDHVTGKAIFDQTP